MNIPKDIQICAVTKGRSIIEVEELLERHPEIKIIAENRWPDCEEKFRHFDFLEKHFIGPLQTNKVRKVVELVDVIQSVDSTKLMEKINGAAGELGKRIGFCIQVNISGDPAKHGVNEEEVCTLIEEFVARRFNNIELLGLMTIGEQAEMKERAEYFKKLKTLFAFLNAKYFPEKPLEILSMGMSEDYEIAIEEGATMVRLGRILWS